MDIPRRYIIDENNRRIGVQLDIDTFERIEVWMGHHRPAYADLGAH